MGGGEILVLLFVIVLLFGARRLPELAKGLGTAVREFKKSMHDEDGAGEFAASARDLRTPEDATPAKRSEPETKI